MSVGGIFLWRTDGSYLIRTEKDWVRGPNRYERKRQGTGAEVYIFSLCSCCARFEPVVSKSCSLKSRSENIYTSAPVPCLFPDFDVVRSVVDIIY